MEPAHSPLRRVATALESSAILDGPAGVIGATARNAIAWIGFKDLLAGEWIGHALHPIMTDVVIGAFLSASLLDLLSGDDDGVAAQRLLAIGIAAYGPTALTGANDWADAETAQPGVRRVGLVHAAGNAVALTLYTASLAARRNGDRGRGQLLALAGGAVMGAGGYLGGHLVFVQRVGVDRSP